MVLLEAIDVATSRPNGHTNEAVGLVCIRWVIHLVCACADVVAESVHHLMFLEVHDDIPVVDRSTTATISGGTELRTVGFRKNALCHVLGNLRVFSINHGAVVAVECSNLALAVAVGTLDFCAGLVAFSINLHVSVVLGVVGLDFVQCE